MVGDSRTGASSRPQIVQMMSNWICRGSAPYFPAHPGNLIDIVALDVAAARGRERGPRRRHLGEGLLVDQRRGGADVWTRSLEVLLGTPAACGREIQAPPVVDPPQPLRSPGQVWRESRAVSEGAARRQRGHPRAAEGCCLPTRCRSCMTGTSVPRVGSSMPTAAAWTTGPSAAAASRRVEGA